MLSPLSIVRLLAMRIALRIDSLCQRQIGASAHDGADVRISWRDLGTYVLLNVEFVPPRR